MNSATQTLLGARHNNLLNWLANDWLQNGPPICFVEGFSGIGKSTVGFALLERVYNTGLPAIRITAPESHGDPTDDLLLTLATELSDIGQNDLANAIDEGRSLTEVLSSLMENSVLIVIDEFQRIMRKLKGRPRGSLAEVLDRLAGRRNLKGRMLLLSNRMIERALWSEPYEIRRLHGLAVSDAELLLARLLEQEKRQDEVPEQRFTDVVKWLGCNPRAIRVLVHTLAYDSLDYLIGLQPELWEGRDREVAPELLAELEAGLLKITLQQISEEFNRSLNRLAVHRVPFEKDAVDRLFSDSSLGFDFRRELIDRFLMEQHRGFFNLHPVVQEIATQRLRSDHIEVSRAHSIAGDHYIRHFKAQRIVGWGRLGGYFVEARYHLVRAAREDELRGATSRFADYILSTLNATSLVPTDSIELDERIAVLASLLETPGSEEIEYHLARLFKARGRRNDLERAHLHIQRALGPDAPVTTWLLASQIEIQAGRTEEAITLLKEGIGHVPPTQNLVSLYQSAGELLAQAGRTEEAITLLKEGIGRVPPNEYLYQSVNKLLAQAGRTEEAITLLKEGIGRVPTTQNLYSLYQSAGELLAQAGRTEEAITLLKEGIGRVPPTQSLFSLYQSAGKLLAQAGRTEEAITLLKEGIGRVPPTQNLYILYQSVNKLLAQAGRTEEAITLLKEGIGRVPPTQNLFSIYQSAGELLAQAGRTEEAITLLKEGIGRVPPTQNLYSLYQSAGELLTYSKQFDTAKAMLQEGASIIPREYNRYRLYESIINLMAGMQSVVELASYISNIAENEPQYHLGQILLRQLQNEWQSASQYGDEIRTGAPSYIGIYLATAFSWLGAGNSQHARRTLEQYPQSFVHGLDQPITWLLAFILFKENELLESHRLLTIYTGQIVEVALNNALFLRLWDTPGTPWGESDLAYYFPVLPPTLTGMPDIVTRVSYNPSVLPSYVTQGLKIPSNRPQTSAVSGIGDLPMDIRQIVADKRSRGEYDVFLCHNSKDKPAVKRIGEALLAQGILPWLDEWDARPGQRWQRLFEEQIVHVKSAAVFVGPQGMGPWQTLEYEALLEEFVNRDVPILPVLLPECPRAPQLPIFLRGFGWVDFRKDSPDPVQQMIWGITGKQLTNIQSGSNDLAVPASTNLLIEIRTIVREEVDQMRGVLERRVSRESAKVLDALTASQVATLSALSEAADENRIPVAEVEELLETVRKLVINLSENESMRDSVSTLPPIFNDTKASLVHRLKVTIPILPILLSYEGEYDLGTGINLTSLIVKVVEKIRRKAE